MNGHFSKALSHEEIFFALLHKNISQRIPRIPLYCLKLYYDNIKYANHAVTMYLDAIIIRRTQRNILYYRHTNIVLT